MTAACLVGIGVTGTLLWVETRPQPASPASPPASSAPPFAAPPTGQEVPQTTLARANALYDAQQWPQAIEAYRATLAGGLDNPNVRTDLGNALRFSGQGRAALEQYQIAQKQDPSHEQSLFNQGGLWAFLLNDKARAIAAWRVYLERFPNGQSAVAARQLIAQNQEKSAPEKP